MTTYASRFNKSDIEILEKKTAYQGHFRIDKYQLRHKLFQGGFSKPLTRELFERGHAVAVLLVDPVLRKIVLIEQFRMGALNHPQSSGWLLELVAGIIEPDEAPEDVARREVQEEAGLAARDLIPIIDYWVSPGASSERVTLFCARVDASQAGGVHGLVEEGEDIRVWVFTVAEVYQLLEEGKLNNALTIIAVQWFKLNEQKVLAQWN